MTPTRKIIGRTALRIDEAREAPATEYSRRVIEALEACAARSPDLPEKVAAMKAARIAEEAKHCF